MNIVEIRTRRPEAGSGLRVVFEDTLQPFAEISSATALGYLLVNRRRSPVPAGDATRARMLLDESAARFAEAGDETGRAAVLVAWATWSSRRARSPPPAPRWTRRCELRREQGDRRGSGLVMTGLGVIDTAAGDYAGADRHLTEALRCSAARGTGWGWPAPSGGWPTWRWPATAWTTRRPRSRRRAP